MFAQTAYRGRGMWHVACEGAIAPDRSTGGFSGVFSEKGLPVVVPCIGPSPLQDGGRNAVELKDSQYASAQKMLSSASLALQQAESYVRRKQEPRTISRRIEEVELFLKKAKRELRLM